MSLLLVAALAAAPHVGSAAQWLALPPADDFTIAWGEDRGGAKMIQRIRRGETLQSWSRMIMEQSFAGAGQTDAADALGQIGAMWRSTCPGATLSAITSTPGDPGGDPGPVARISGDCPLNTQTGRPESLFAAATRSGDTLYVARIAIRRKATGDDIGWADALLSGLTICVPNSPKAICQDQ